MNRAGPIDIWPMLVTFDVSMNATWIVIASIPRILGLIALTIQVAFMDTSNVTNMGQISIGPARFMDVSTSPIYKFAVGFDVFAIWNAVLIGVGIAVVGKVAGARAALGAAIVFLLGAGLLLLQ